MDQYGTTSSSSWEYTETLVGRSAILKALVI